MTDLLASDLLVFCPQKTVQVYLAEFCDPLWKITRFHEGGQNSMDKIVALYKPVNETLTLEDRASGYTWIEKGGSKEKQIFNNAFA